MQERGDIFIQTLEKKVSPEEKKLYKKEIRTLLKEAQTYQDEAQDVFITESVARIKNSHFQGFSEDARERLIRDRFEFAFLDVALSTFYDRRLREDTRDKRLAVLEKIADRFDGASNDFAVASNFIFNIRKEQPREVISEKIASKGAEILQIGLGGALGFFGADLAEKYVGIMPSLQIIAGTSILAVLFLKNGIRDGAKYLEAKNPKIFGGGFARFFDRLDKFIEKAEPVLAGLAGGLLVHTMVPSQNHSPVEKVATKGEHLQITENIMPENVVITHQYTFSGSERGLSDVLASFNLDPYGEDMTRFILQNKEVLADPARRGHEVLAQLVRFLENNPGYSWRDAMNASAQLGHPTEISKMFTEALSFIRPGTIFQVPMH